MDIQLNIFKQMIIKELPSLIQKDEEIRIYIYDLVKKNFPTRKEVDDRFDRFLKELKDQREENNKLWENNNKRWEENNKRWEENNKRWKENEKRWDKNEKRWEENEKRWEENEKRWDKNEKRWEENEKRWDENEKRWDKNEKRWDENEKRWDENKKSWEKNNQTLDELKQIVTEHTQMIKENRDKIGNIEGELLEIKYRNRISSYFGTILLKTKIIEVNSLLKHLRKELTIEELKELFKLDILVKGKIWDTNKQILVAMEISSVVDINDVNRVLKRCALLLKAGYPTIPAVAGKSTTKGGYDTAKSNNVILFSNGSIDFWENALNELISLNMNIFPS